MREWNNNHGPDKLYNKFRVEQVSTGKILGEDGEFVFVMRPESDEEAHHALLRYAELVEHRSPNLARHIREQLNPIRVRNEGQ